MKKIVIFDLDGTLANITHRLHFIIPEKKDWNSFYEECVNDEPIKNIIELAQMYSQRGYAIYIITGRSVIVEKETINWLYKHHVPYDRLLMRPDKNYKPDIELKQEILNYLDKDDIQMVFEDRKRCVEMYRDNGLTCLQVSFGDF